MKALTIWQPWASLFANGVTSMLSDMNKHEETRIDPRGALGALGMLALMDATKGDASGVRRFIEGFN